VTMMEEREWEALKTVIAHHMSEEQKHFEEGLTDAQWAVLEEGGKVETDHIFCSWQVLDEFVKRMEDEGPRED